MSTNKSSKLAVTDMKTYLAMEEVHTRADKEINRNEFVGLEKIVNSTQP